MSAPPGMQRLAMGSGAMVGRPPHKGPPDRSLNDPMVGHEARENARVIRDHFQRRPSDVEPEKSA